MNNKFTTFILTILLIVLLFGGIVLGGAIYMDIVGEEAINETYTVGNIVTEEPEEEKSRNLEITKSNISSVQGNTSENLQSSQEVPNTNADISINKYFYNQLFGNQKIIYDKMLENKDNLKLGNYKIEFSDTFSDTLSTDDGAEQLGKDYQTVLIEPAILESIKQGISQYTAEETITKRSEVADVIINLLKNKLENKGVTVTALNITDLSFSEEFDTAVEQKQIVEQETQKAQYELEKAKVENEKKIENAKADAEVMRQQNEQITDNYLRLKEIENEQKAIEKWNGQLPTTTSDAIPFINVN